MRALALLLILANVIFFAWQQGWLSWLPWQPEQFEKTVSAVPPTKTAQLTLLSERQAVTATENQADTTPGTQPAAAKEDSVEKSTDSPTATTVPKTESTTKVEEASPPVEAEESPKAVIPLKSEEPSHHSSVAPSLVPQDKEVTNKEAKTATPEVGAAVTTSTETSPSPEKKVSESSHAPLAASPTKIILPPPTGEKEPKEHPEKVSEQDTTTKKTEHPAIAEKETTHTQKVETTVPPEKTKKQPVAEKQKISNQGKKKPTTQKVKAQSRPKSTAICLQVGPYPHVKSTENVATWFNGQKNVTTQVQKRQTPMLKRTRVYLPPFKSRTEALNVQKRLNQQGVNDHQILTDKELNNAISLGVYRDQLSVQRRFEELSNKGYKNIKAEKYYERDTKYWLSVKIPASQNKLVSTFKKEFKGTRVVSTACEESLP